MKVQELRQLMEAADMEHLMKAFAESYKQLRKGQKEEIDPLLIDILKGNTIEKKKEETIINFEELALQTEDFIGNARAQNYFAPNRVIPKAQRSKWRFMVKNFIKELSKISIGDDNYLRAVKLLTDLYDLMCEGCRTYLFSTEDPFRSIGWDQAELFDLVVRKTFAAGYLQEDILRLLLLSVDEGLSTESLKVCQEMVFVDGLKTGEAKCMALEEVKKQIEEREKKLEGLKKHDNRIYTLESKIDEFCGIYLMLKIVLAKPMEGVEYYFMHCTREDKEYILYRILEVIDRMEEDALWMEVYEYGVRNKIKPREFLQQSYEERKSWME